MLQKRAQLFLRHLRELKLDGIQDLSINAEGFADLIERLTAGQKVLDTLVVKEPDVPILRIPKSEVLVEKKVPAKSSSLPKPPLIELPEGAKQVRWDYLKDLVLNDRECQKRVKPGKQVVFGVGDLDADIFFCGEAPGVEEEVQGEPFVGRAGELLTKIIQAMGLSRERVYIGNIMNWRPEMPTSVGDRLPTQEEMEYCLPYLKAQLEVVKPKVVVALGATAVNGLLGKDPKRRMGDVRGTWQVFNDIPLMITFHPSYLLRNGSMKTKRRVWEDMLEVMERLEFQITERQRGYFLEK